MPLSSVKIKVAATHHLCAALLLASLGGALMCSGMAGAQPQPIGTAMTKAQADQSAYASMLKQEAPLEKTDPAAALAMLQQFAQNHPTLDPDVRVSLLSKAAYLSNASLKDGEGALKIASQSLKEAQTAVDEGASDFLLHFDGLGSGADSTGQMSYSGTGGSGSHSDSIYLYGSGATSMNHVASDALWNSGTNVICLRVDISGSMSPGSVSTGGETLAGPAVNDADLSMSSGLSLFYPAAQTPDQISLDW